MINKSSVILADDFGFLTIYYIEGISFKGRIK